MESSQKRKLEEEPDSQQLLSPEKSPKKKTAIMYPCADQRCTKSFVQKHDMEHHLRDAHKDKYCFACNKHFDKVSIGYHLLQVHQGVSQRGKFRCSRCPGKKAFTKEQDFMDHVRWKHNGCAACGIFFKYHHSCTEHFYDTHHICRGCGERFCGAESLQFHGENSDEIICHMRRPLPPVTPTAQTTQLGQQATIDPTDEPPELQCRYCDDYRTRSWDELERHCNANHKRFGELPSWCGVCQEQLSTSCGYKLHFITSPHHFICEVCEDEHNPSLPPWRGRVKPRDYESQEALDKHRTDHHVRCEPCGIWLYGQQALDRHRERRHLSNICKSCDIAFPNNRSRKKHLRSNKHKGPFECLGCLSEFDLYSSMFQHLESGKCDSNITQSDLILHIRNVYREPTQDESLHLNFQCPYLGCKKKFTHMSLLFQHLENRECSLRGWQHQTSLKKRLLEPLEELILAPLRCTECDEYFGVEGLDEHIRDEHDSLFCFICNQHFSSRERLRFHIQVDILDPRGSPHEDRRCELCTKGPRIYRGEKKFYDHMWTAHDTCAVCAFEFNTKKDLIEHDRKVHFKCHVCSDLSEDAYALRLHLFENHLKFSKIEVSTWRGAKPAVADELALADLNLDAGPLTPDGSLEEMMRPVGRQPLITGFFR